MGLEVRVREAMGKGIRRLWPDLRSTLLALLLSGVVTLVIFFLVFTVGPIRGSVIYLIPVVFAALRWGPVAAVVSMLAGALGATYLVYPPAFGFHFHTWNYRMVIDLTIYFIVSIVVIRMSIVVGRARIREETDVLRQALIDSVSHELRSPLSSILGAATVLGSAPPVTQDRRLGELVNGMREEAERLNRDIQNMIDASRVGNEGIRPRREPTEIADIVNAAVARCRPRIGDRNISVVVAPDLPILNVDPAMVAQAVFNLLDNAAKYSPPDSPIGVSAGLQGKAVAIAVADRGSGLSAAELPRIWDRFWRGERHAAVGGSGLGLWIARAFVTANGGTLTASSTGIDRGTTMTILFPAQSSGARKDDRIANDD